MPALVMIELDGEGLQLLPLHPTDDADLFPLPYLVPDSQSSSCCCIGVRFEYIDIVPMHLNLPAPSQLTLDCFALLNSGLHPLPLKK